MFRGRGGRCPLDRISRGNRKSTSKEERRDRKGQGDRFLQAARREKERRKRRRIIPDERWSL